MTTILCAICGEVATNGETWEGRPICARCKARSEHYQGKKERRVYRLHKAAARADREAESTYKRARQLNDLIPFGQPILVGHHSEGRDRRFRDRIWTMYGRSYGLMEKAAEYRRRAERAEKNRAISSDDPTAVIQLREKIAKLEAEQAYMKKANAEVRKAMKKHTERSAQVEALIQTLSITAEQADALLTPDFLKRIGFADYQLRNNNANIRRLKARLAELEQAAQRAKETPQDESEVNGVRMVKNAEENRLQLFFPGKPERPIIQALKARGFRWSPSQGCWQRMLNNGAEYAAEQVLKLL